MDSSKTVSSPFLAMDALTLVLILGVAFAVLILLIQLIYVCKVYPKNQVSKNSIIENIAVTPATTASETSLMDDKELVAVIMAAIYASMGADAPVDGLVVRSIRKINK